MTSLALHVSKDMVVFGVDPLNLVVNGVVLPFTLVQRFQMIFQLETIVWHSGENTRLLYPHLTVCIFRLEMSLGVFRS